MVRPVVLTVADLQLVDLEPGDDRLDEAVDVLRELRPHLTAARFAAVYAEGHPQGLRFTAAYDGGRCVGVAGWRIVATTASLRKLYVDDLVTTAAHRSRGVGGRCSTPWRSGPRRPAAPPSISTRMCSAPMPTASTSARA